MRSAINSQLRTALTVFLSIELKKAFIEALTCRPAVQGAGDFQVRSVLTRPVPLAGKYAAACRQLGAELGVPVLDLWTQLQTGPEWSRYLSDGLHLSPAGNLATFQLLLQLINDEFSFLR